MTDGNVYGGFAWTQQQADALTQFINQLFQREYATGYVGTQPQLPGQAEMRTAALNEIYSRRQDIQDFYDEAWGDKGSAISRMENWLGMTQERMDPEGNIVRPGEAGYEQAGTIDPALYASNRGWIDLPEGWGEDVGEGEKKPTIEKLTYDLNKQKADWQKDLDQQGLDLQQASLDLQEKLGMSELELREALGMADLELRSQVYLSEAERDERRIDLAERLGIGQLELDQLIAHQQNQLALDQLALQRYMYDSDTELENKKLELQEKYNEGDLSVRFQLAAIQELQVSNDYDIAQKRIQLDQVLGERSLDLQEKEQIDNYSLNLATLAQEDEHFSASLGYDYAKLQQQATEFQATHGLAERGQAWEEEYGRGQLGLGVLTLLSQLRGPQDWQAYASTLRGAEQGPYMEWANKLLEGQGFAPFQATMTPQQQQQQQFMQMMRQGQVQQGQGQQQGLGQAQAPALGQNQLFGGYASQLDDALDQAAQQLAAEGGMGQVPNQQTYPQQQQVPYGAPGMQQGYGGDVWGGDPYAQIAARPQMVSPDQWANMTPSERDMLLGAVEGAGGYAPDWFQMMQKAAPTGGRAQGTSWFGGGW